jgi:hypothetical protein
VASNSAGERVAEVLVATGADDSRTTTSVACTAGGRGHIFPAMEQPLATRGPALYAEALEGVWHELGVALARLEELAGTPARLADPEEARGLGALQYRLHAASEAVLTLAPPPGAEDAHLELAAALVAARDATARVAYELETGESFELLVFEWRGALFRVRLARAELRSEHVGRAPSGRLAQLPWAQLQGALLLGVALFAIAIGAHASAWAVVAGGAVAVPLSLLLLLRP